jgi:4'-phosphopantetheinyl transferase
MTVSPEINWPAPPALWSLGVREAHVWAATLARSEEDISRCAQALSADELDRANRFRFERDRRRFIAGRGLLRAILSHYVGREPPQIKFDYSSRGKPTLAEDPAHETLHFNLAHSDDLLLLAVTRDCAIGVDVERLRILKDAEDMAERFFSVQESSGLKALPEAQKPAAFFRLWTRKEACLKATGAGITEFLSEAQVSYLADEPARLTSLFGDSRAGEQWRLCELAPAAGFVAALAVAAPDTQIKHWQWTD